MTQDATPLAVTQDFGRQLSAWLEQWAKGAVRDQHALYLDKVMKQRVDQALAHAPAKSAPAPRLNKAETINAFLDRFDHGDFEVDPLTQRLENMMRRRVAEAVADQEEFQAIADSTPSDDGAMHVALADLERAVERTRVELARAHDWRYNLESHSREAFAAVRECLDHDRPPTKDGMNAILATLREGIEWTP